MILETELKDCRLRPWRQEDKPDLLHNANNRKVWLNLTDLFPSPYTEADADFWISLATKPSADTHFTIEFKGKSAGGIGIIPDEGVYCKTAKFGYWLGEDFWDKGIATAAAKALVGFARSNLPFVRYEASVYAWNPASMRVLEKAGFTRESLRRRSVYKDRKIIDSVMYVLIVEG